MESVIIVHVSLHSKGRRGEGCAPVLLGHSAGPLVEHEAGLQAKVHVGHVGQGDGEQGAAGDSQARVLGDE